jgi:radical SAM superfamily enzyme YgiQ (UPF0313 family)
MIGDVSEVKILDLLGSKNPGSDITKAVRDFKPDIVGISFATPTFNSAKELAGLIKECDRDIFIMCGGPHATIMYEEVLNTTEIDFAVLGEGDYTIREIVENYPDVHNIKGTAYKKNGKITKIENDRPIADIDALPFPRWELVENKSMYRRAYCRKSPIGIIQTSRGCPACCVYCNKNIFGRRFRPMSPARSVDEIEHTLDSGFKEIHVMDDTFSLNLARAKNICDEIIKRGLNFPWSLPNGIRVDRVDKELLEKMHNAGCYSVSFGVESGNQSVLNAIQKNITKEQVIRAVKMAKEVGLETNACFMLALPTDTEETMHNTIDFALELDPDIARFTIAVPFPGTEFYDSLEEKGLIHNRNWDDYHFHKMHSGAYSHPNLDWDMIYNYYNLAYKKFYLRPGYICRRLLSRNVLQDTKSFIEMFILGGN